MVVLLHPTFQVLHAILEQLDPPLFGAEIEVGCCLPQLERVGAFVIE